MSEVYWMGGAVSEQGLVPDLLDSLLAGAGIRPNWIDGARWAGPASIALENVNAPVLRWPAEMPFDHLLLHDAARSVLAQDFHLLLFGIEEEVGASAGLLASPKAVGRYNLSPRARLLERVTFYAPEREDTLAGVRESLIRREVDPGSVAWLVETTGASFAALQRSEDAFTGAEWLPPARGVARGLLALVAALEEQEAALGLLVGAPPKRPVLATLVERV